MRPRAVIFDVNETVLELAALDHLFVDWFGDPSLRRAWFAQTINFALTLAATRTNRDFGEVGAAALGAVAQRQSVKLPEGTVERLRDAAARLPPHPDVVPALEFLREKGLVVAALSNNPFHTLEGQLRHAGLAERFDHILSVDQAGALKPAPEVYQFATERLIRTPGDH